jgi:hypothetical protein
MSNKLLPQIESNSMTIEPGVYIQNPVQHRSETIYPWAPTTIIQKAGASISADKPLVDVSSDLLNIVRPLSKDPSLQHKGHNPGNLSHLKDGFFHQESSLLTNPPLFLRGQTKNRWEHLMIDPQASAIEPFQRNGLDTYIDIMNNFKGCPVTKFKN